MSMCTMPKNGIEETVGVCTHVFYTRFPVSLSRHGGSPSARVGSTKLKPQTRVPCVTCGCEGVQSTGNVTGGDMVKLIQVLHFSIATRCRS